MTTKQPKDFTTTVSLSYDEALMIHQSLLQHETILDQILQGYEERGFATYAGERIVFPCSIWGIPYDNIDDVYKTLGKFDALIKRTKNIGDLLHAKELARHLEAERKELNQ